MEQAWADAGFSAEQLSQARSRVQFAEFFPAFRSLAVGPLGTMWVQHVQPISELSAEELGSPHLAIEYRNVGSGQHAPASEWDVFDSDGRFLGAVTMPPRFTPRVFRGDKVYGVWRDELDVQYVMRLHIIGDLGVGSN